MGQKGCRIPGTTGKGGLTGRKEVGRMKKRLIRAVALLVFVGVFGFVYGKLPALREKASGPGGTLRFGVSEERPETTAELTTTAQALLTVYICGEVRRPGVYTLDETARIEDLVNAAGGALPDADLSRINLAQKLTDGQQVIVYAKNAGDAGAGTGSAGKVNLNLADKEELMTLPGIGEARAESILAYREEIGWFQSPEELMNISGIKEKMYEKIADRIEV